MRRLVMTILVMGVSGSGKSTLARGLADDLGWAMLEADDFHPAANKAKMAAGIPLDDSDRAPWLVALAAAISDHAARSEPVVLACSALKEAYRQILRSGDPDLFVVWVHGPRELLAQRMAKRSGHFMPPALWDSQFATLETPHGSVRVDSALSTAGQLAALRADPVFMSICSRTRSPQPPPAPRSCSQ